MTERDHYRNRDGSAFPGYDAIARPGTLEPKEAPLQKPFRADVLTREVRKVLDRRS